MAEDNYSFNNLFDEEAVRQLIRSCDYERANGSYPTHVSEGDRLADEFRKLFPEVSDKDIGCFLIVIARVLGIIYESSAAKISSNLDMCIGSYSHAAAQILKSVIDLKEL